MKLYESLFILTRTYDNIKFLSEIMWDHKLVVKEVFEQDEKQVFHYLALFNHIIMESCSFMEEYEKNFQQTSEDMFQDRIKRIKVVAKPIVAQIYKWKALREFRNQMIAHPWRIGKTKEFTFKYLFSYDIPTGYLELQLLRQYLRIIITLIEVEFFEELGEVPVYMQNTVHSPRREKNINDWYEQMISAVKNVNIKLSEFNYPIRLEAANFIGELDDERSKLLGN